MARLPSRRTLIAAAAGLLLGGATVCGPALAAGVPADAVTGDMSLGDPKAPIHVVEYASMSCPHCARFDEEVFPTLKSRYIDTGRVYFTLKEYLTPPEQVAAAGFLIARCGGKAKYFPMVDGIFKSQPQWRTGSIKPIMVAVAEENGVSAAQVDACLEDPAAQGALNERIRRAMVVDKITSTPTVLVNGKPVQSATELTAADLEAAIAKAQPVKASAKGGGKGKRP